MTFLLHKRVFPAFTVAALSLALAAALLLITFVPAVAAEVVPVSPLTGVVDLAPQLAAVLTAVASVIGVLAMFAIRWVLKATKLTGVVKDDTIRQYLSQGLEMAVHYAVSKAAAADWSKVDTKNAAVSLAVSYALDHIPDALHYFGFDSDKLSQLVEGRLAAAYPDLVLSATQPSDEPGVA